MTFPSIVFSGIGCGSQLTTGLHTVNVCQEIHYLHMVNRNHHPVVFFNLLSTSASCDVLLVCRLASAICQHWPCVNLCFSPSVLPPTSLQLRKLYKSISAASQNSDEYAASSAKRNRERGGGREAARNRSTF